MRRAWQLAFTAWAAVVIAVYYRRAWRLVFAWPEPLDATETVYRAFPPLLVGSAAFALVVGTPALIALLRRPSGSPRPAGRIARCLLAFLIPTIIAIVLYPRPIGDSLLPWAGDAARRAFTAIAAATVVTFDACVGGRLLLAMLGWRSTIVQERLLFSLGLGFGLVSYLSLALAAAGWYRPPVVTAVLTAWGIGGLLWLAPSLMRAWSALLGRLPERFDAVSRPRGLWVAATAAAVAIGLVGALAPETEYDALWYHLWLPDVWLRAGGPVDVPTEFIALYPLTWELVFGAGLALDGAVAAKLLHFVCLPLTCLAVWQFTRRFLPGSSPWLATAVFVSAPTALWESTTAYIDLALALYVVLGLYALLACLHDRSADEPNVEQHSLARRISGRNAWFAVAAACFGLAVATKHLGLVVLAVVSCATFVHFLRRGALPRAMAAPAALIVVAMVMAAPWYVRAWTATGNPFFPEMYDVFGAPADRWDEAAEQGLDRFKTRFGTPRTASNLLALPWSATMHGAQYAGSLGPIFLLALPAIAAGLFRRFPGRAHAAWLGAVSVAYFAVWASPVSSFQMRFLVPLIPSLAILSAGALQQWLDTLTGSRARRHASAVIAVLLFANLPPFIPLHEGDRRGWSGWLTHVVRDVPLRVVAGREPAETYLRERVATYGAWTYAARHLPAGARVLEFGGGDNFYATRDRVSMDARPARGAWLPGDLRRTLNALDVTHILFDRKTLALLERDGVPIALPAFRQGALTIEYQDGGALLYRYSP